MSIDIRRAYCLAPLAENTHAAFRRLLQEYGPPDLYFTEMLSAAGLVAGSPFTPWYLDISPAPEKTVVQFVGGEKNRFREAAEKVAEGQAVYGFDINMGCSVPKITRRGWGAALLSDPQRAAKIAAELRRAFPRHSISAKLRLGDREEQDRLLETGRMLQEEGLDFLTLHPKTSRTVRSRPAKWDYVALLRRHLRIPVVGNGGISSPQSLRRRRELAGAGGVMVGRGAVWQPWIFTRLRAAEGVPVGSTGAAGGELSHGQFGEEHASQLPAGEPEERDLEEAGRRHLELIRRYLPLEFHLSRARRFFFYFCDNLRFGYRLKMHMQEAPDTGAVEEMWTDYFRRNPKERRKRFE